MGKMSREKGKRFEREIANYLKERGYDARRSAQFCGKTGDAADVVGIPGVHIEAKHVEAMRLYDWIDQAVRDSEAGQDGLPCVFHKKNNAEVLVTMRLKDWIKLYEKGYGDERRIHPAREDDGTDSKAIQ